MGTRETHFIHRWNRCVDFVIGFSARAIDASLPSNLPFVD